MKISFWPNAVALNGKDIYKAFEDHVSLFDTVVQEDMNADAACIWSVLWRGRMQTNQAVYNHYRSQGKPVIIMEVGVLKRNHSFRIAVNHINNTGYYGHTDNPVIPGRHERFNFEVKDYHKLGNNIVICCQNESSELWREMPTTEQWLDNIIPKLKLYYPHKNIVVRPHPRFPISRHVFEKYKVEKPVTKGNSDDTDFVDILKDAFCVVSPTGGAAIEAIIGGVPVITSPESLASDVARTDYQVMVPDLSLRKTFVKQIRNTEWFIDEVVAGEPYRRLRPYVLNQTMTRRPT
jgi:hypothetical protein